jgi:hypothetical protein
MCGGLVRISVSQEAVPYAWRDLEKLSGMSNRTARGLYRTGVDAGSNPIGWRAVLILCCVMTESLSSCFGMARGLSSSPIRLKSERASSANQVPISSCCRMAG